ncbi:hypothetical protein FKG94_09530 [Exilibacterium tricleocarpae]|uniref:Uncharacterized protein n=1 Tax=Exilibacterium tricleocarpae TaxID=2591008 RepID=A0A545TVU2_9GAMM|nr:hypothetical protein [Exilibacterium tricleocarpae]TQV81322.1 hypothetical protein FKG94_09530 [Exilibacterium tricleocarpae]
MASTNVTPITAGKPKKIKSSDAQLRASITPCQLDQALYVKIQRYVEEKSWRQLAQNLEKMVRHQFAPALELVDSERMLIEEVERQIKLNVPSKKYIQDYVQGRPICYRYTNTLANFFAHEYSLRNHNPCDDYIARLTSKAKT